MADNNDISQLAAEAGADSSSASVTQDVTETGAAASTALISQEVSELGAGASVAVISQEATELGADESSAVISQVTLEYGRGPEIVPPDESPVRTFTVGAGLGSSWYIVLQLSDSGHELRDKVVKSLRVTGKLTNAVAKIYAYGPKEDIAVEQIEDGIGQKATIALTNTTQVQQSRRFQVNVKNAMTHTVRVEGSGGNAGDIRDRIDEIVYEVARQGVRR